ncbi:MAG: TetR family transcriptional regulator [Nevskia sp.]|nr:TetR family transcriptional regulator [Nevskia sp.]
MPRKNAIAGSGGQESQARQRLKDAARRLFALRGFGVTTREIVAAAGQRNLTAINYHFGSKDGLIDELIADLVQRLEVDRNAKLDRIEAAGGPDSVRCVVEVLASRVEPPPGEGGDGERSDFSRFLNLVLLNHRDKYLAVVGRDSDSGTHRCLRHLRRLLAHLPEAVLRERLYLVMLYLLAALSAQEAAAENPRPWRNLWTRPNGSSTVIDGAVALLEHTPSADTLRAGGVRLAGKAVRHGGRG